MLTAFLALALVGAPQDSAHLVIVATADVQGRATGWDYVADAPTAGGLARAAAVVDSLRARYPGQVVAVDAGDVLSGDPFGTYVGRVAPRDPHPMIEALNLAGFDAGTPGDHDFDLGFEVMRRALGGAAFPYVSGNLLSTAGDTLLYPAFVVLRRGGVRVAVTGFTSPTATQNDAELRARVRLAPIGEVAPAALARARREADVVVALVHADQRREVAAIAAAEARPDLIVTGRMREPLSDSAAVAARVVQPDAGARRIAVVHLSLVRSGGAWRVRSISADMVVTDRVAPAARVASRLAAEHEAARAWAQQPVGWTAAPFPAAAARAGPSALVDFVNRVQRTRAGADLAATPAYSLTAGLTARRLRRADVLALVPSDYTLVAVKLSGDQLRAYLEQAARYFQVDAVGRVGLNADVPGEDFDIVGGATYEIDLRAPVGSRLRNLAVRGRAVQPSDSFTLALPRERLRRPGGYDLGTAPVVYDRREYLRDLLVEEIGRHETLDPAAFLENGWRIVPAASAAAVDTLFGLPGAPPPPPLPRDSTVLRILALGGVAGRFDALPAVKMVMDSLAQRCACGTLRLETGDAVPAGTAATTVAADASLDLLGQLGLTAAVPGERELDWPRDTLHRRAAADYPWLAANVFDVTAARRPDGTVASWSEPYQIVAVGRLRVAILAYVAPEVAELLSAARASGLRVVDGMLALRTVLDEVKATRPDVTILLAHGHGTSLARLARELPRGSADVILAGQGEDTVAAPIDGNVPVVRVGGAGVTVVAVDVRRTVPGGRDFRVTSIPIVAGLRGDPALVQRAERFRRGADSAVTEPVAALKLPLRRDDRRLGQLFAEARRNALRGDAGLVRVSDLQDGLAAGPIASRDLLRVQPANRALAIVTLKGKQVTRLFEEALTADAGSFALAGMEVRYDPKRAPGRRVRQVRLEGGRELDPNDSYRVVVDVTLLESASGLAALRDGGAERSVMLDVDALLAYLRRLPSPVEVPDRPGFLSTAP